MPYSGTGDYSAAGPIFAGGAANGTLTITSGSYSAAAGTVGGDAGITGTMTLTGAMTDVSIGGGAVDGQFRVGEAGTGTLNIQSGAEFSSYAAGTYTNPDGIPQNGDEVFTGGYLNMLIGEQSGSTGTVNVTGAGSTLTTGGPGDQLAVGLNGTGTLNINSGGLVESFYLIASRTNGSTGTVNVDGPGSRLELGGTTNGSFRGTFEGEAAFLRLGRESGSLGYMNVTNGGIVQLTNVDGSDDGPVFDFGRNDGAYGRLDIDGAGSEVNIIQTGAKGDDYSFGTLMRIGRNGTGVVELTNNAAINITGDGAGIRVGDASSSGDLVVDPESKLHIYSGSDVTVDAGTTPSGAYYGYRNGQIYVGRSTNGRGEIIVDGVGSTLTVEGYGGGIIIGRDGQGELTVSDGADVSTTSHGAFYDPTPGDPNNGDEFFRGGYRTFVLGEGVGSIGTATVTGAGSSLSVYGDGQVMRVANYGTGTLDVLAGGTVSAQFVEVGRNTGSDGAINVSGAGSVLNVTSANGTFVDPDSTNNGGFLRLGREAGSDGSLTVSAGGTVNVTNTTGQDGGGGIQIARFDQSVGNLTIDGTGTSVNVTHIGTSVDDFGSFVGVGLAGQGSATISNNAQLNILGDDAFLGVANSSSNNIIEPSSTLDILSGADVLVDSQTGDNPEFEVAANGANSRGDVTVDGTGSTLTVTGGYQRGEIGRDGIGTLTISNGGYALFDNGTAGAQNPNYGGYFTGGYGNLRLGRNNGGEGTVTVIGNGSRLVTDGLSNRLNVGRDGDGTLNVVSGGRVDTLSLDVGRSGRDDGNRGTVNINNASIYVGALGDTYGYNTYTGVSGQARFGRNENEGDGRLNIINGGTLNIQNVDGVTDGSQFKLGQQDGSYGRAIVDGVGSEVNVTQFGAVGDDFNTGARARIGQNGQGVATFSNDAALNVIGDGASLRVSEANATGFAPENVVDPDSVLNIQSGADATVNSGTYAGANIVIADGANGRGVINVDGAGSTLSLSGLSTELTVGNAGRGTLNITGGAAFNNISVGASGFAGRTAGSYGLINVDGATSSFYMSGDLNLGGNNLGEGILLVQNGATAEADTFNVGYQSGIAGAGTGTVVGDVVLNYGGVLAPGDTGPYSSGIGALAITGNLTATNGIILGNISGTAAAQSDTITVSGTANLNQVEFELQTTGFTPNVGDQATLLSATGGLTFNAANASFYGGGTQAFSIAASGNDLIATMLNNGSGAAILDLGAGAASGASTNANNGSGSSTGGTLGDVAFTGVTEIRGTDMVDTISASGSTTGLTINGRGGDDILIGGNGVDTIEGGLGLDRHFGGQGDDIYIVESVFDIVGELTNQGNDSVFSSDSYFLSADVENLTLTGTASNDGVGNSRPNIITGNSGANGLSGGNSNDLLIGGAGNDSLDGQNGIDIMRGGTGSDGYNVDRIEDVVEEDFNGGEFDILRTAVTYTLPDNVEIMILKGGSGTVIDGTGNDGATDNVRNLMLGNNAANRLETFGGRDVILGRDGDDTILAGGGADNISGGNGADIITGGAGADFFNFTNIAEGGDLITDFSVSDADVLDLRAMFDTFVGGSAQDTTTAQANGYLQLVDNGNSISVNADSDGGGDNYQLVALLNNITDDVTVVDNFILV